LPLMMYMHVNLEESEISESFKISYHICDVLRWRAVTCTCKFNMHCFSLAMIQLPIVSVSVGVQ